MAKLRPLSEPKQPYEAFVVAVPIALDADETLTSYSVTAWDMTADEDASAVVVNQPFVSAALGVVQIPVQGGVDGHRYRVTIRGETSATPPRRVETDLLLVVKET